MKYKLLYYNQTETGSQLRAIRPMKPSRNQERTHACQRIVVAFLLCIPNKLINHTLPAKSQYLVKKILNTPMNSHYNEKSIFLWEYYCINSRRFVLGRGWARNTGRVQCAPAEPERGCPLRSRCSATSWKHRKRLMSSASQCKEGEWGGSKFLADHFHSPLNQVWAYPKVNPPSIQPVYSGVTTPAEWWRNGTGANINHKPNPHPPT